MVAFMSQPEVWANHANVEAASRLLNVGIAVAKSRGEMFEVNCRTAGHPVLVIAMVGDNHYLGVVPLDWTERAPELKGACAKLCKRFGTTSIHSDLAQAVLGIAVDNERKALIAMKDLVTPKINCSFDSWFVDSGEHLHLDRVRFAYSVLHATLDGEGHKNLPFRIFKLMGKLMDDGYLDLNASTAEERCVQKNLVRLKDAVGWTLRGTDVIYTVVHPMVIRCCVRSHVSGEQPADLENYLAPVAPLKDTIMSLVDIDRNRPRRDIKRMLTKLVEEITSPPVFLFRLPWL